MTYDEFLNTIKERAQERLGKLYKVSIKKVLKNNGVLKDALCLSKTEAITKPALYLNAYYDLYQGEMTLDDILDEILEVYEWNEKRQDIWTEGFLDFEKIKDRIVFRLINAGRNQALLESVPYICYQDLAIVFCIYQETQENFLTMLIHREHLKRWGIGEHELYDYAKSNTPFLLPAEIKSLEEKMKEIARESMGDSYSEEVMNELLHSEQDNRPIYVLSNWAGVYGAACILYDDVLKDFSERIKSDMIVIFSSIHEVLLIPDQDDIDIEAVKEMVRTINSTEVGEEDFLTDEVYRYSRVDGILTHADIWKTGFSR